MGGDGQKKGGLIYNQSPGGNLSGGFFYVFSLRVVVPLDLSKFLIKGSESCSVDWYSRGVGVTGVLKKCEKNVKSYLLRETVKQEPVGRLSLIEISQPSRWQIR